LYDDFGKSSKLFKLDELIHNLALDAIAGINLPRLHRKLRYLRYYTYYYKLPRLTG